MVSRMKIGPMPGVPPSGNAMRRKYREEKEMCKKANARLTETQLCFEEHMDELGLICEREFKFDPDRQWKSDYMIKLPNGHGMKLIEFEGGAWTRGRHTRGQGFINDLEKYNTASALGYKVFRFTPDQVKRGEAKEFIRKWL